MIFQLTDKTHHTLERWLAHRLVLACLLILPGCSDDSQAPSTGSNAGIGSSTAAGTTPSTSTSGGSSGGQAITAGVTTGGATSTSGTVSSTGEVSSTGGVSSTGNVSTGNVTTGADTSIGSVSTTSAPATTGASTTTGADTTGGTITTTGAASTTGEASTTGDPSTTGASTTGASTTGGTSTYQPCPTDGSPCRIMPFGDSITDGFNGDTQGGYRIELYRLANQGGKNITFVGSLANGPETVDGVVFPRNHEGHSGWTIDPVGGRSGISSLLTPDSVMLSHEPDIVLLMIGTNDAIDNYDMAEAPTRLGNLIDTIYTQLPDVLIIVAQPIPSREDGSQGDDTELSARIQSYNAAIPNVVQVRANAGKHIDIVDMFTPFNANKAALLQDQWHPNGEGYALIGTQWYAVLEPYL